MYVALRLIGLEEEVEGLNNSWHLGCDRTNADADGINKIHATHTLFIYTSTRYLYLFIQMYISNEEYV